MRVLTAILIGLRISTTANAKYVGSREGSSLVIFELARVVRTQPVTKSKSYSVTRTSCTTVEDLSNASNSVNIAGDVVGATPPSRLSQRCIPYNDKEYKQIITGYDVTFEYLGQIRTVRMENDPGTTVRVKAVTNVYVME